MKLIKKNKQDKSITEHDVRSVIRIIFYGDMILFKANTKQNNLDINDEPYFNFKLGC